MAKFYSLLLLLLACCGLKQTARAQSEFRPGYVVRTAGDTLRGAVDYRGAQRSARICRFRPSATAPIERYTPAQLRGYGFWQSKTYDARLLPAIDSAGLPLPQRLAFLEVLAPGAVSLYYRLDEAGHNHFYIAKATTGPVTELVYTRELITENGSNRYRENNRYRGTLSEAFASCPAVQQQAASTVFTMSALTGVVQRYNACAQPGAGVRTAPALVARQSRLEVGLLAGAEISRLVFADRDSPLDGTLSSSGAGLVGGLSLHYTLPAVNERLALRLEALLEHQKYAGEMKTTTYYYGYNAADLQVNATYLRLPLLVRYSFPLGHLRPFLQVGVTSAFALSYSQQLRFVYTASNGTKGYSTAQPVNVRTFETAPTASFGLQLPAIAGHGLQVEAQTERGGGLFATSTFDNAVWRYFLLLGFGLSK